MPHDAPLPYPLAGADAQSEGAGAAAGAGTTARASAAAGASSRRSRRWRVTGRVAIAASLATSAVLLVAVGWLAAQRSADRALIEALSLQRDEAVAEAQLYRAAAESAISAPVEDGQAFSIEMIIASVAVGRFLQEAQSSASPASPEQLVQAFFQTDVRTTAWLAVPGNGSPPTDVLARVDRPADPGSIWVSRRSEATADPSVPTRTNCLRLEISALLRSADALRPYGSTTDSAPLRWWADVYRFVPPAFCGMVSSG